MRLRGRRVLVTGAASGIGLAVTRLFQRESASIAMLDRDEVGLTKAQVESCQIIQRPPSIRIDWPVM